MRNAWWLAVLALGAGCDDLEGILDGEDGGIASPTGTLTSVKLVQAPTVVQVLAWQCDELNLGLACIPVGPRPSSDELAFDFDLNFDLQNPNVSIPIPMVEALLGITVFDTANLGSVCVSLCDPDDATCRPGANAQGACDLDGAPAVLEAGDLVPTVPELVRLIEGAGDGTYINDQWRILRAGETTEVTLNFSLAPQALLELGDELLVGALDDLLTGSTPTLEVPYTTEGTLFFDVPTVGTRSVGFGPFDDAWLLEPPQ